LERNPLGRGKLEESGPIVKFAEPPLGLARVVSVESPRIV